MAYINENGNGPRAGRTTGRQRMTLVNLRSKQAKVGLPDPGFVAASSPMAGLAEQYQTRLRSLHNAAPTESSYAQQLAQLQSSAATGASANFTTTVTSTADALQRDAAMRKQAAMLQISESGNTSNQYLLEQLAKLKAAPPASQPQGVNGTFSNGFSDGSGKLQGENNAQVWMNHNRDELQPYYAIAAGAGPGDRDLWRRMAKKMANEFYGWGADQFALIDEIVMNESKWNPRDVNKTKPAYGIAQTMMNAHFGEDWKNNPDAQRLINDPVYQIAWMLKYIADRYGTPQEAVAFKRDEGWY